MLAGVDDHAQGLVGVGGEAHPTGFVVAGVADAGLGHGGLASFHVVVAVFGNLSDAAGELEPELVLVVAAVRTGLLAGIGVGALAEGGVLPEQ